MGLTLLGLLFALLGLGFALATGDRFFGVALLLIGAFLAILPLTRPSLDE